MQQGHHDCLCDGNLRLAMLNMWERTKPDGASVDSSAVVCQTHQVFPERSLGGICRLWHGEDKRFNTVAKPVGRVRERDGYVDDASRYRPAVDQNTQLGFTPSTNANHRRYGIATHRIHRFT